MQRFTHYLFGLSAALLVGITAFAFWYSISAKTQADSLSPLAVQDNRSSKQTEISGETLLSDTENAYNPIPNPDDQFS